MQQRVCFCIAHETASGATGMKVHLWVHNLHTAVVEATGIEQRIHLHVCVCCACTLLALGALHAGERNKPNMEKSERICTEYIRLSQSSWEGKMLSQRRCAWICKNRVLLAFFHPHKVWWGVCELFLVQNSCIFANTRTTYKQIWDCTCQRTDEI